MDTHRSLYTWLLFTVALALLAMLLMTLPVKSEPLQRAFAAEHAPTTVVSDPIR